MSLRAGMQRRRRWMAVVERRIMCVKTPQCGKNLHQRVGYGCWYV